VKRTPAWHRSLALAAAVALAGPGCAGDPARTGASWHEHMQRGALAVEAGDPATGVEQFRQALESAQEHGGSEGSNELAYSAWHLGDLCFKHPDLCQPGDAETWTLVSLLAFERLYGPEHPVVIPVLLRMAEIREGEGDGSAAVALRARADGITARSFPESHYLRSRLGTHRPASGLHPQELLRILADVDLLDG